MNIIKLCFGQLLSFLFVVKIHLHKRKYDKTNVSVPFFIDNLILPALLFVIIGLSKKATKRRNDFRIYFGCILDGLLDYVYSFEIEKKLSLKLEDGFLAFNQLGYFICMIFTYLISDKFPRSYFHFSVYLVLLVCGIIKTCYEKRLYTVAVDQFIGSTGISILLMPTHLVLCNIISNETGIMNYIFLKSPIIVLSCLLHFREVNSQDFRLILSFLTSKFIFVFFYLCISLCALLGSIIYTQKYGIVSMGMLSITNFVFYRFLNMFSLEKYNILELVVFGILYLVFLSSSCDFKKQSNTNTVDIQII